METGLRENFRRRAGSIGARGIVVGCGARRHREERKGKGGRPLEHDWITLGLEASRHFRHDPKRTHNAVVRKLKPGANAPQADACSERIAGIGPPAYEDVQKRDTANKPGKRAF